MTEMERLLDPVARAVFTIALRDGRAGELLNHLFEGGGVTFDQRTNQLILVPANVLSDIT